jgi:nickel-dependent lactate racemase
MADELIINEGGRDSDITADQADALLAAALPRMSATPRRVLLIPPDHTRLNSGAGDLTVSAWRRLTPEVEVDIMPALGTHNEMTPDQLELMFGSEIPFDRFLPHDFRNDVVQVGEVGADVVADLSGGVHTTAIPVSVNRRLLEGEYDLILSIGQVVPHEVVGMANYTKNICIGVGGVDMINCSHYLSAVQNLELNMGRTSTPVRRLLDTAFHSCLGDLPIWFLLTVMEPQPGSDDMTMRGLFAGRGHETFAAACALSEEVNVIKVDEPLQKVVTYLDEREFKSTWLGNKAVYRTRLAIADGGELVVLAPGLCEFGEDGEIDRLIAKYGYTGSAAVQAAVRDNADLRQNTSAAAHLIHGSSEGRFRITYCPGPGMSHDRLRSVGYEAADLDAALARYQPATLDDGFNTLPDGERIYFIRNPALGLWSTAARFDQP